VTDPLIAELRERITAADRAILAGVNRRLELVEELRAENRGPLSDEGVEQLFRDLLALTKRELAR